MALLCQFGVGVSTITCALVNGTIFAVLKDVNVDI